ncbi:hypothetical protein ACJRO7_018070 [Eucalyptus globulus]|uniref:Uncharacterized protein n=1 Tax=Eucalyptus globulus TaxID=34317 RepID=A0ABD3KU09_EUCGL
MTDPYDARHKSSESNVVELDPLVGHDGEQCQSVLCCDLQLERELVGKQDDQKDGGGECECVEDQEDVKGHQVVGVDSPALCPWLSCHTPTRWVEPSPEGDRSDQGGKDQEHVADVGPGWVLSDVVERAPSMVDAVFRGASHLH